MTAPGDYVLIFLLLALFLACVGYAAGRLHQRWQAAQDREEAYRDGYENGSSNVFSTAVRMLGPRRSARGAASVRAAEAASSPAAGSASPRRAKPAPSAPPASPAEAPPTPVLADKPPVTASAPAPAADAQDASLFGFPAPEPPPPYAVTESAAVGGLLYRPFVDPRPADGSAPVLGDRTTYRALPRPRPADPPRKPLGSDRRSLRPDAPVADPRGGEPPRPDAPVAGRPRRLAPEHADDLALHHPEDDQTPPDAATEESSGRHTVPDELVRAATYRLPPDRVFRAKVPDGSRLPEDPASLLGVPKPRQS